VPRALVRILIGVAVFFGAATVSFFLTPRIASETLRVEAEERLSQAIRAPIKIGSVRLVLGFGLRLEGTDVFAWREEGRAPSLRVDRIRASIPLTSLIFGKPRFSRIIFDGARLRIERDSEGNWSPAPITALAARRRAARESEPVHSEELLSPLITVENGARAILGKRRIADVLELRNATIVFIDDRAEHPLAPPLFLALESVQAEMRRSRLTGASRLTIKGRLVDAQRARGTVEWEGTRDRRGAIRVAVAVTDLEFEALAPYVRSLHPAARVEGSLSGAVVFETASPGDGRLEVDFVGHRVRTVEPRPDATTISVDRIEAVGTLEITPRTVRLHGARLRGGELFFEADGTIARPLQPSSFAQIALAFQEVEVAEVRHLIGWLPEVEREEAESVVEVVETGRFHSLRAGGSATLSGWQAFLAGRTRTPPAEFFIDATLSEAVVKVGDDDRLEDLQGRLWWSGNRAEVAGAHAMLNGSPLPIFDVVVEGVTNFLAGDPERRRLVSGGAPLIGLQPFWEWFQRDADDEEPTRIRIALGLGVDRLHHPMFLWPIENSSVAIWDTEQGLHIVVDEGTWAGVPISGEADWVFEPEERVRVHLTAGAPAPGTPVASATGDWAEGSLVIDLWHDGPWQQQHAVSRFTARGGVFRFDDVEIPLNPRGKLGASLNLDFGLPDAVPFQLSFALAGGNVTALAEQLGQAPGIGTGSIDLAGSFHGAFRPQTSVFEGLTGLLDVVAVDGTIRRSVPAVLAVALASQAFNPFARREEVRYERCETVLEFEEGRMSTTGFSLDGPDVRVFASGEVDLLRPPHQVDAQIALFLFRQIDKILGKIPIVNLLLLGTNENLVGAHFQLTGPWEDPQATAVPLRALASGPASIVEQGPTSLVLESIPMFMMKAVQVIESMLGLGESPKEKQVGKEPFVPEPSES
jgi:hypothetical protein